MRREEKGFHRRGAEGEEGEEQKGTQHKGAKAQRSEGISPTFAPRGISPLESDSG